VVLTVLSRKWKKKLIISFYMNVLKLIGRSEEELRKINYIKIVKTFSYDLKMKFGCEECARISLTNGSVHRKQNKGNTMEN
jgi:hypothetical protein